MACNRCWVMSPWTASMRVMGGSGRDEAVEGGRGWSRNELRGQHPLQAPPGSLSREGDDRAHSEGHDLPCRITDENERGKPAQVREVSHEHRRRRCLVEYRARCGGIVRGCETSDRTYAAHGGERCRKQLRRLLRPELPRMEDLGDTDPRAPRGLRHPLDLAPASVGERARRVLLLRLRLAVLHEIAVHRARKMIGRAAHGESGGPLELHPVRRLAASRPGPYC